MPPTFPASRHPVRFPSLRSPSTYLCGPRQAWHLLQAFDMLHFVLRASCATSMCVYAESGEKEQGGRVYAFSPSLLIINVSQVCKIARRSLSCLSPSGFPFSLFHSSSLLFPDGMDYHSISISLSPQTLCCLQKEYWATGWTRHYMWYFLQQIFNCKSSTACYCCQNLKSNALLFKVV